MTRPTYDGRLFPVKIFLPRFASCPIGANCGMLIPTNGSRAQESVISISNPITQHTFSEHAQENRTRIEALEHMRGSDLRFNLGRPIETIAPRIPDSISRRVLLQPVKLLDRLNLVWEASWKVAPAKDPLIIGVIEHFYFLLDQWEPTQLERYVTSEFVRKPEA